jgi:GTPase SAR1 family protein
MLEHNLTYPSKIREHCLRAGDAVMLVFSITNRDSFNEIREFYTQLLKVKRSPSWPAIIVGYKADSSDQRQVTMKG